MKLKGLFCDGDVLATLSIYTLMKTENTTALGGRVLESLKCPIPQSRFTQSISKLVFMYEKIVFGQFSSQPQFFTYNIHAWVHA